MLCRDRCGYCTFAKPPARLDHPTSRSRGARHRRHGAALGCHEALFTLGEAPEARYPEPPSGSPSTGTRRPSTTSSPRRAVLDETGLLPHANAGVLTEDELSGCAQSARRKG